MFRKYTALAAAVLLASTSAVSLAECRPNPWDSATTCSHPKGWNQACNTTCGDECATSWCSISTSEASSCICEDRNSTCSNLCIIESACGTTAAPPQQPVVQPTKAPVATQAPSPGDDYTTQSVSMQEQKMANLLNQDRNLNGLAALTLDPELCRIARIKSADMRDNHYFAHESPTYGKVGQMLRHFGYAFSAAGENIAHHANVDKAQAAFMSSQGHRANILNSGWTKFGIGIVQDAQGYIYVTQIFAR